MSKADEDATKRSILDDPDVKEQILARARSLVDVNRDNQRFLARQADRLNVVFAKDVHESVRRAVGHIQRSVEHHVGRQNWLAQGLAQGIAAVEQVSCLRDAGEAGAALLQVMEYQGSDELTASDVLVTDLGTAVDAVEFGASTDRSQELRKASGAMERILGAVTELREMGFSVGEIQSTVDDFITQKTKPGLQLDFSLLAPVIAGSDSKGTTRNKRMAAKRREQLLEADEWVRRFLNDFWCKYWRNAFERSIPDERELSIECARDVIPDILDAEKGPLEVDSLVPEVWGAVKKRRQQGEARLCRIRLKDEHVLIALDRLVQSGGAKPTAVVRIAGEASMYWTRHRAQRAGLDIAPSRLSLVAEVGAVPEDGGRSSEKVRPPSSLRGVTKKARHRSGR